MIKFKDILIESIDYKNHHDVKLLMKVTKGENLRKSSDGFYLETPNVDSYYTNDIIKLKAIISDVNSKTSELQFILGHTNDSEYDDERKWNSSYSFSIRKKLYHSNTGISINSK